MQFYRDADHVAMTGNNSASEASPPSEQSSLFRKFAQSTAEAVGSPWAFAAALGITLAWAASGPIFHYSDTWQLIINTVLTIATFLIVILIQHTQNRDARVMHLKLDELIRALGKARNELVHMENLSDRELQELQQEFQKLQTRTRRNGNNSSPHTALAEQSNSD